MVVWLKLQDEVRHKRNEQMQSEFFQAGVISDEDARGLIFDCMHSSVLCVEMEVWMVMSIFLDEQSKEKSWYLH